MRSPSFGLEMRDAFGVSKAGALAIVKLNGTVAFPAAWALAERGATSLTVDGATRSGYSALGPAST